LDYDLLSWRKTGARGCFENGGTISCLIRLTIHNSFLQSLAAEIEFPRAAVFMTFIYKNYLPRQNQKLNAYQKREDPLVLAASQNKLERTALCSIWRSPHHREQGRSFCRLGFKACWT
jgi:hypothetical protein